MADPTNLNAIDDIKFLTGYNVDVVVASETTILETIEKVYVATESYEQIVAEFDDEEVDFMLEDDDLNVHELEKEAEGAPVVRLVNAILLNAIQKGASDIHIEPYERKLRVRYRIDGVLVPEMEPPMRMKNPLVSRLKIMSQMDIAERRLAPGWSHQAQDAEGARDGLPRQRAAHAVRREDGPPSPRQVQPAARHDEARLPIAKPARGLPSGPSDQPWGMVLVTGPTGSGKTTTLYSALTDLNKSTTNISTAEDPGGVQPSAASTRCRCMRRSG